MKYCPGWVFDATAAEVAMQFLLREFPLSQIALKHAQGLSKLYFPIENVEVQSTAEMLLSFLSEVEANEDAVKYLSGFGYFRVNYKSNKTRRNLNSAIFKADAGTNYRDYDGSKTLKGFRAYVHSLRADVDMPTSSGWSMSLLHELPSLASISKSLTETMGLDVTNIS